MLPSHGNKTMRKKKSTGHSRRGDLKASRHRKQAQTDVCNQGIKKMAFPAHPTDDNGNKPDVRSGNFHRPPARVLSGTTIGEDLALPGKAGLVCTLQTRVHV